MLWGVVVGLAQAATPLACWWLDSATVYALGLSAIAAIYIGFAVSDGRAKVIAVESGVAFAFILVAAAAVTGSAWLLVVGLFGHGLKDLWQHRTGFVRGNPMVAAVLHGCRLRRLGGDRHRDRRGGAVSVVLRPTASRLEQRSWSVSRMGPPGGR